MAKTALVMEWNPNTRPQGESFDMATESINAVLRALNLKVTNKTNIFYR